MVFRPVKKQLDFGEPRYERVRHCLADEAVFLARETGLLRVGGRRTAVFIVQRGKLVNHALQTGSAIIELGEEVMRFSSVENKPLLKIKLNARQETMNHDWLLES